MNVDMKFEVAIVPVSDVDRAKAFYTKLTRSFEQSRIRINAPNKPASNPPAERADHAPATPGNQAGDAS